VVETIFLNIRTPESSTTIKINVQCSDKEEMRSSGILGGSQKVFYWYFEDHHGFDPSLVQHTMKPARKKQGLVNSTLETPFQKGLENFLRARIIFSVHPEWVSNWVPDSKIIDHIRTFIHLHTFS
jgi:hypothetical protein